MTERKINGTSVRLLKEDVTDIDADAFVFYATENLVLGSGYGTAISIRGGPSIQQECNKLSPVPVGEAVVTAAGEMKARYIIHAVGPKFQEPDEQGKLRRALLSALKRADEKGVRRLALPPMGTGFYGIPVEVCARVMLEGLREYLQGKTQIQEVLLCARDTRELKPFGKQLESM